MSPDEVSPQDAAITLAETDRIAAKMHKDVYAMRVAMVTLAAATIFGLLIIGLIPSISTVIAGTIVLVAVAILLAYVGAAAGARDRAFRRRYLLTTGCWALLYVAAIWIGTTTFHQVPGFWIPAAILCAIPPVIFVITGSRTVR